jgi:hypothetical protein
MLWKGIYRNYKGLNVVISRYISQSCSNLTKTRFSYTRVKDKSCAIPYYQPTDLGLLLCWQVPCLHQVTYALGFSWTLTVAQFWGILNG